MGKSTISMAISNSFLYVYQAGYQEMGIYGNKHPWNPYGEWNPWLMTSNKSTGTGKRTNKNRTGKIHHAFFMGKSTN